MPAILVHILGTAGAAATPFDGYPIAKAGKGPQALAISCVASTRAAVLPLLTLPWLAKVGYVMHSVEMIVVMLFGNPLIPALAGLFAISEAFMFIESRSILSEEGRGRMVVSNWATTGRGSASR